MTSGDMAPIGEDKRVERLRVQYPGQAALIERAVESAARAPLSPGHPEGLAVADLLATLHADGPTVVAALISVPELDEIEPTDRLEERYGQPVASLARSARWLIAFREHDGERRLFEPAERLRRMILAMARDVRAVLIRLAYRTCRMRDLHLEDEEIRSHVAHETLELYAPLANRLGIFQLKWEMEDRAFRSLQPEMYKRIADGLAERRADREAFVGGFVSQLQATLAADGIDNAEVFGRPKHIYSIWRKMQRKHIDFEEVFDTHAVRVLVDRVRDCYTALGTVHGRWPHVPDEFDDYIAKPKENGYQSLHTAVIGPHGRPVEVQIRTREMNDHAEKGVAAHWLYKEGSTEGVRLQHTVNALRTLLDSGDDALADSFGRELFSDRVFVFTRDGDVVDLPQGATVLDFAYAIHTDVGHRCRGAKINGRIVPLTHVLGNGEQVQILTTREGKPNRDWLSRNLGYLRTSRARAKVRAWFNQQGQAQHVEAGRGILERELRRLDVHGLPIERLLKQLRYPGADDLYAALGRNDLSGERLANAIQALTGPPAEKVPVTAVSTAPGSPGDALRVHGVGDLLTRMASCCKPVPGDGVIGYITRGRGVTVHRRDCHNVLRLEGPDRNRLIEVEWGEGKEDRPWSTDVVLTVYNRDGLLRDITHCLGEDGINVTRADLVAGRRAPEASIHLTVEIRDMGQLNRALQRLDQLPNVLSAERKGR